jgi:hypothetical protein
MIRAVRVLFAALCVLGLVARTEAAMAEPAASGTDACAHYCEVVSEYTSLYGAGVTFDYVLALVPDPQLSERTAYFEDVREGIDLAMTAHDEAVRDRQWLPWPSGCADKAPGVEIFRPQDPTKEVSRVVLLVGETPTWGVRKAQLEAALDFAALCPSAAARAPRLGAQKVLGPTYSGTAPSVASILKARAPKAGFEIASGTATSELLPKVFEGIGSFFATVPDDHESLQATTEYLGERGGPQHRIAILSESSTVFGSNVNQAAGKVNAAGGANENITQVRFSPNLRKAVASAPSPSTTGKLLTVGAEDPQLLELDDVARDLSRDGMRFVGVVATDAADVVRLQGRLRTALPDVRFFTLGGDILYTTPELASALNGMLVAHAVPPEAIRSASVSFKNELVRGVYLAGRRLLGDAVARPVTRISMIGNGSLWEIGDSRPTASPPRSWHVVMAGTILVFLVAIVCALWPWLVRRVSSLADASLTRYRGPIWLSVGRCEHPVLRAEDTLVTASMLSIIASACLVMCIAEWAHGSRVTTMCWAAGSLATVMACWGRALWSARKGELRAADTSAKVFSVLGVVAAFLALGIGCAPAHEATLNLLSGGSAVLAALIGFGMIALAQWCWRVRLRFLDTHRFGHGTRASEPPLAEALAEEEGQGTGFFELEKQLLRVIHSPWQLISGVPIAVHALLVLNVTLVYFVRPPSGFERGWRNTLVMGFALLSLLPITVNFSRILSTWVLLNRVLRRLALLPVLDHLRRLPPPLARKLQAQLTVPNVELNELAHPVALLERIGECSVSLKAEGAAARRKWEAALRNQAGSLEAPGGTAESPGFPDQRPIVDILLNASATLRRMEPDLDAAMLDLSRQYLAILIAIFIPRYLRHFRLYVVPVLAGSVLGVLMTSLYFVQPQRLLTTLIFLWVAGMVISTFGVYAALDRSAVISAIGNTTAGSIELDWTFFIRVITWGIVPLLSLLAARYPGFSYDVSLFVDALGKAFR